MQWCWEDFQPHCLLQTTTQGAGQVNKRPDGIWLNSDFTLLFRRWLSEAATETVFQNICSFLPGATILQFSRRLYLSVEQTCFFQKGLSICQRDMFFPGESIILCSSNRHKFSRRVCRTDNDLIISSNRYQFSRTAGASIFSSKKYSFFRKPYLIFEHILFSRRPLCIEQIGIFQEGTLRQTDISLIGLDGCFRVVLSFSDWAVRHFTSIWSFFLDREIPDLGLKPRFFSRQTSIGEMISSAFFKKPRSRK